MSRLRFLPLFIRDKAFDLQPNSLSLLCHSTPVH
jgi:hypothetical protein